MRKGIWLCLGNEQGQEGWGEVAPLPNWSAETLEDAESQLHKNKKKILALDWALDNWTSHLEQLQLLPSVSFGLESALLSILSPLSDLTVEASALLMGSPEEICEQAAARHEEGFRSAKLKVGNLKFSEAAALIKQWKDKFHLRIDVNRAWGTEESLEFFSQFPLDSFDYVEEPFQNPKDLAHFPHPLAVDESFPQDLSLQDLEVLPNLKALIYKPTIQGGLLKCFPLYEWTKSRGISLVISSSFETRVGLSHVASIAHRLSLSTPVGIGTVHHLQAHEYPLTSKTYKVNE